MLSDRNYYGRPANVGNDGKRGLFWLLGINIAMYLLAPPGSSLNESWSLFGGRNFHVYQLVTYMFLHGGFTHILFNMWGLYIFGTLVTPHLSSRKFIWLYLISGLTGGLLWLLFNNSGFVGVNGASGALFGVMLAGAMLEPEQEFILLLFPVPIKARTMIIVFALLEAFSELSGSLSNIAHIAHLGGFIGGYIFLKIFYHGRPAWDPLRGFGKHSPAASRPRNWKVHPASTTDSEMTSPAELDRILDKLSQSGINSLTEAERNKLKQAREQFRSR